MRQEEWLDGNYLGNEKSVVSYHTNMGDTIDRWDPPKNSAIQIAAAITACSSIYMYPSPEMTATTQTQSF